MINAPEAPVLNAGVSQYVTLWILAGVFLLSGRDIELFGGKHPSGDSRSQTCVLG